jgi:CubicO group peptidase (beta-lactamase class C family)
MRPVMLCVLFVVALTLTANSANSPAGKPEEVGLSSERLKRITAMIERRVAAGQIAGAVTIVGRRGKVVHHVAQGVMDRDTKQPMAPGTMFRIASMTKPVVGVAVMMLVEESKLHLNDPVARYIPEFQNMKVAVAMPPGPGAPATAPGTAPRFYTVPAQRAITIKDLLTHTSGLGSARWATAR